MTAFTSPLETCVPCNCINQLILGHLGHDGFLCGGSEQFKAHELRGVRQSVQNAAMPRGSLLVHAYGREVTGLKTYRGPKCKEQLVLE